MGREKQQSYILIFGGTLILLLIVGTFIASMVTRDLSQKAAKRSKPNATIPQIISPTPKERSIYLDLPKSFPRDLPIPAVVKVTVAKEEEDGWTAVFSSARSVDEIRSFYFSELPKAGWTITSESQAAGILVVNAEKGQYEAIIATGRGEQGITVSVTILKSP